MAEVDCPSIDDNIEPGWTFLLIWINKTRKTTHYKYVCYFRTHDSDDGEVVVDELWYSFWGYVCLRFLCGDATHHHIMYVLCFSNTVCRFLAYIAGQKMHVHKCLNIGDFVQNLSEWLWTSFYTANASVAED